MPVYTVDASVFLNAFNPAEPGHTTSQQLLSRWQAAATPMIVPTLLLPEAAAAVSRGCRDADLAVRFAAALRRLPHMVWVPLDDTLARQAAEVAARHCLRGSDAVYAAVALRFGSRLVTLDEEQRQRVANVVSACRPGDLFEEDASGTD